MLRFEVDDSHITLHKVHEAGGGDLREYWIPAEDLDEFHAPILGDIEVIGEYRGQPPQRIR